ncbi:TonB-dependent receptor plug domain-containing protein [Kordiimonas aquimaris]|uniref:TonB-dependent receptor plug domain-containing protein n=1 Tax=Kordiimonas aquimaris TaxID=707591 RepID=UPI0021CEF1C4|nr:TonB-dependent receptor [Kordiimonas aquimaris]
MAQELKKFRRAALLGSAATLVASLALGSTAYAQDADSEEAIEEVVVTGSRIIRRDVSAPNPVNVVGAIDIRDSGETDVSKLLREIPALNGSLTATGSVVNATDSADLNDDAGIGRLNLRNLGINRTLVLVNGRRHVSAIQGSGTVDVSTIPIALIDRVETATGGGSSVYGADAVSGVVNFILKDDFEGLDYRAQYSLSDEGDADNIFVALTGGTNFANDRGNVVLSAEYTRQSRINRVDRDDAFGAGFFNLLANSPALAAALGRNPDAAQVFAPDFRINFSSSAGIIALREAGAGGSVFGGIVDGQGDAGIIAGIPALQVFDGGSVREFNRGIESSPFNSSGGDGIQAANPNAAIVPYIDRINLNGLFRYELTDNLEFYAETKYVQQRTEDADGIPFNDDIPIALDNAFIPAGLRAQIDQAIADGITPAITLSRDILDQAVIGQTNTSRNTLRLVGGFRGEFDNGWRWDASYNYGRTEINTTNGNSRVEDRFFAAVDAVVDPTTGNIVCRSDLDSTALPPGSPFPANRPGFLTFDAGDGSCRPLSLFGTDSITSDAIGFAFIDTAESAEIEQRQVLVTLAGDSADYFELPAGSVGFAVGFEYRDEKSSFTPPELERAGLLYNTLGEARDIVNGQYDVAEVFGEVSIPILADLPFVESLTLDGSFRYTDHSTAGSIETYGGAIQWRIDENIRISATYNRAVRAPNIFELFSPAQPAFIGVTADPCAPENIGAGTPNRAANCATFVDAGFDPADFLSARVAGSTGGNANLAPETADTYTIGVVLTPSFAPGLTVRADYYNIEIEDAIDALTGREVAELCVDLPTTNNPFCAQVQRDPANGNAISDFQSGNVNLGGFSTEGLDLSANYVFDLERLFDADYGVLNQTLTATHVFNNIEFPDPLDPNFALDDNGQTALPEWIVNYQALWSYGDLSVTYQLRYQSSQLNIGINNEDVAGNPIFADPLNTGSAFVHDISATYRVNDLANITFGINNLGNRSPFIGSLARPVDPIGRTFFVNIGGSF